MVLLLIHLRTAVRGHRHIVSFINVDGSRR